MLKKIIFIFSIFTVNNLFSQTITVTQKIPETVVPGTEYIVEITINKAGITGFMKFFQDVPARCNAIVIESKGGAFSFADGGAKIIWISPPAEDQFTISYKVIVPKDVSGVMNLNGKIGYLDKNERKEFELETHTIELTAETTSTVIVNNTADEKKESTPIVETPVVVTEAAPKKEEPLPVAPVEPEPVKEVVEEKIPAPVAETPVVMNEIAPKKEEPLPVAPVEPEPVKEVVEEKTPAPVVETPVVVNEVAPKKEEPLPVAPAEPEPVKEIEETPLPVEPVITKKEEIKPVPVTIPVGANIPVTAVPSAGGKTFRVQIGAFNLKPTITGVPEPSTVLLDNGMTKYFSGNFTTYEAAVKRKKEMIEKGFQGAFIVSFENGKIVK